MPTEIFWAQHGRLFHGVIGGDDERRVTALCGRDIPPPRMTVKDAPLDDDRCAKCDRILRGSKADRVSRKIDDALDNEDALKAAGLFSDEGDL